MSQQQKPPWLLIASVLLAFAVGVPMLARVIREIEPGRQKSPEQMALDRSGDDIPAQGTFITAHCSEPCRLGSYVKLIAGRTEKPVWLVVYAEDEAKNRVWYFPTPSGQMPMLEARRDVFVLSEALKLSDEHKSEREWTLRLLLVDQKTTRDELAAIDRAHVVAENALHLVLGEGKR